MKKIIFMAIVVVMTYACGSKKQENASTFHTQSDTYTLPKGSPVFSKITVTKTLTEDYSPELRTTGTVRAINGQWAEIASPFAGRINRIHFKLGQHVAAGALLCELNSSDYFDAAKSYFQALAQKNQSEKQFKRQQDLAKHGIGSQKDLEMAQMEYESAKSSYEQEAARMKIFNPNLDKLSSGQSLMIKSPIAGEVVKAGAVLGQYIKEDAEPVAIVADLHKVWVVAQVKERYINFIQKEDKAEIYSEASPDKLSLGKIVHIGEIVDPESRSIEVIVECDNAGRKLKPGMFARVDFLSAPAPSILIPASAVMQEENNTFVLVQQQVGTYQKRKVKVESAKQGRCRVLEGLDAGETIVTEGSIYILED